MQDHSESKTSSREMHSDFGLICLDERCKLHLCFQLHKNIINMDETRRLSKVYTPVVKLTGRSTQETIEK